MANNVTTEWEDIHVKLGNYLPREKEKSNDELQKIAIESIQNYDPLEHKTLDQLKKMEEEDDDDEVIKAYEAKRLAELKEFASKPKFGKVHELRKQDYIDEVTHAPKDVYVVLHLYQTSIEDSNVLGKIFDYLAKKYVLVKFMKIVSTNCIENFSDKDVPAVIIYQNGKLIRQFIPAVYYFGGSGHLSWQSKFFIF